jgi:hypothetical protein
MIPNKILRTSITYGILMISAFFFTFPFIVKPEQQFHESKFRNRPSSMNINRNKNLATTYVQKTDEKIMDDSFEKKRNLQQKRYLTQGTRTFICINIKKIT